MNSSNTNGGAAVGVQKLMLKNKGTLRLNITDICWTNLPKAVITYTNYIEKWHAKRETRVATLSFTYRFGKIQCRQPEEEPRLLKKNDKEQETDHTTQAIETGRISIWPLFFRKTIEFRFPEKIDKQG